MGVYLRAIAVDRGTFMRLADDTATPGWRKQGFADGADACEHEYIILPASWQCRLVRELQIRLNRQIGRIAHRQQLALLVTLNSFNGFGAIALLPFRQRNTGIDADPLLLQHAGFSIPRLSARARQHADNRGTVIPGNMLPGNQRLFGFSTPGWVIAGSAMRTSPTVAGFGDFRLLLFINKTVWRGLHITGQTHNLLLGFPKNASPARSVWLFK